MECPAVPSSALLMPRLHRYSCGLLGTRIEFSAIDSRASPSWAQATHHPLLQSQRAVWLACVASNLREYPLGMVACSRACSRAVMHIALLRCSAPAQARHWMHCSDLQACVAHNQSPLSLPWLGHPCRLPPHSCHRSRASWPCILSLIL